MTHDEAGFMRRALRLAARGRGRVEPNPMVGCVLVRGGRIIAEGYHRRFGGPHAEVEALRRCDNPRGCTAYVTLEPCCFHGKTPPCTEALIAAGVRRVVAAMTDPHPRVRGRGLRRLRQAGIETRVGLLEDQARQLNAAYLKLLRQRRPWVILKWAQSLDGKIATRTGDSKWISDEACRRHAHRTRGFVDAILVGVGTVLADDPLLTCRLARPRRVATRIVLDSHLRTPARSQLVRTARQIPTWIACSNRAPARRAAALERAGCRIVRLPRGRGGLDLARLLDVLGEAAMTRLLVEGGGRVLGSFFDAGLFDELHVYIAPRLIGGAAAPGPLEGRGVPDVRSALRVASQKTSRIGDGWVIMSTVGRA